LTPLELARALVAMATSPAALGAVASRYLAVGTPRSFGIVGNGEASLEAHRTWFAPVDIRRTAAGVPLEEVLMCDIVCIHEPTKIERLRRGTHVNALAPIELAVDAQRYDLNALARIAAGFVDGRQLDEITVFTY
jgi:ornithine cyclodeaminase/alanine dehydrogenase-like protein (mu-crystallin family)